MQKFGFVKRAMSAWEELKDEYPIFDSNSWWGRDAVEGMDARTQHYQDFANYKDIRDRGSVTTKQNDLMKTFAHPDAHRSFGKPTPGGYRRLLPGVSFADKNTEDGEVRGYADFHGISEAEARNEVAGGGGYTQPVFNSIPHSDGSAREPIHGFNQWGKEWINDPLANKYHYATPYNAMARELVDQGLARPHEVGNIEQRPISPYTQFLQDNQAVSAMGADGGLINTVMGEGDGKQMGFLPRALNSGIGLTQMANGLWQGSNQITQGTGTSFDGSNNTEGPTVEYDIHGGMNAFNPTTQTTDGAYNVGIGLAELAALRGAGGLFTGALGKNALGQGLKNRIAAGTGNVINNFKTNFTTIPGFASHGARQAALFDSYATPLFADDPLLHKGLTAAANDGIINQLPETVFDPSGQQAGWVANNQNRAIPGEGGGQFGITDQALSDFERANKINLPPASLPSGGGSMRGLKDPKVGSPDVTNTVGLIGDDGKLDTTANLPNRLYNWSSPKMADGKPVLDVNGNPVQNQVFGNMDQFDKAYSDFQNNSGPQVNLRGRYTLPDKAFNQEFKNYEDYFKSHFGEDGEYRADIPKARRDSLDRGYEMYRNKSEEQRAAEGYGPKDPYYGASNKFHKPDHADTYAENNIVFAGGNPINLDNYGPTYTPFNGWKADYNPETGDATETPAHWGSPVESYLDKSDPGRIEFVTPDKPDTGPPSIDALLGRMKNPTTPQKFKPDVIPPLRKSGNWDRSLFNTLDYIL